MTINCLELLDAIERQEMLSLTWGNVDGSMSRSEVLTVLPDIPAEVDVEALLEELIERCLVIETAQRRIRSRFAESIRLLTRTRQLFGGRPWHAAPRLVSDFRVDLRRRRYPSRNLKAVDIANNHQQLLGKPGIRRDAWQALAEEPGLELAGFQQRATMRLLGSKPDSGTIVTAGTGSGKTLAFYLPVLIRIAEYVEPHQSWVKCLAIYPRIELLKDQLAEAFRRARGLDSILLQKGKRLIRVGAYFGSTPRRATVMDVKEKWPTRGGSFLCPWMRCPACDGDLLWKYEDLQRKAERLVCAGASCHNVITGEQLALTRESLNAAPPDILFTTSEMLNQRMSDLRGRSLFGIGQPAGKRPLFALLDEVHTYIGTSGAHAALVLRRWRHLVDAPVVWCGLSATLQEAPRFFADLVGLGIDQVEEVTPKADEMREEGAEYQVVVRGDPLLEASLLSTTIQSTMLLARMMDPARDMPSKGAFGRRIFVFTDNLDVINRLYNTLQDAEGYTIFGRPDPTRPPLAALRAGGGDDDLRRDRDGQRWRACEKIGRNLSDRLVIGRTSSQDPGVLAGADVIIATPSLEVGYNDDQVGAVIQHKAPRNMASFLQRKGRAGRQRRMRPFTVTVLSDYGRDKIAFQTYEHLFDPVLPPQYLPVKNQYVLRMQGVFALLEWLSLQVKDTSASAWMWDLLSRPNSSTSDSVGQQVKTALGALAKGEPIVMASLRKHLCLALQLPEETVDTILWDPPRSLMLEAVPTLVRRFFMDWQLVKPNGSIVTDMQVNWHPLPDFMPRNLFSDLSLPEVQLLIPAATVNHEARHESMPIVQALQQLAPGRVTRRFAFERGGLYHWAAISTEHDQSYLKVDDYARQNEYLGEFEGLDQDGIKRRFPVFRPWIVELTIPDTKKVLPTSNAMPRWISAWTPHGVPLTVDVPSKSAWYTCVTAVRFHLHRFRSSVGVQRFTHQVDATIRQYSGDRLVDVLFTDSDERLAAVGFEIEVDGFYVDVRVPSAHQLAESTLPAALAQSNRTGYFRYRLLSTTALPKEVNALQREWIFQIFLCAVLDRAVARNLSLSQAALELFAENPLQAFSDVMRSMLVLREHEPAQADEEDENDAEEGSGQRMSRLEERLSDSLGRPDVLAVLMRLAEELDKPDPEAYGAWLRTTIHETLGEALLQACSNTAPRHAALDTLLVDIDTDRLDDSVRIWITESTLGGAGVIQAFAEAFTSEPRALFRAVEAAIAPSDLELASYGMRQFVELVTTDAEIGALTREIRASQGHDQSKKLRDRLYRALSSHSVEPSHAFSVSLNARLLRPGSTDQMDSLLARLALHWEDLEQRFGVAIGLREFCCIVVKIGGVRNQIIATFGEVLGAAPQDVVLIAMLSGVLWPKGIEIRQRTLQSYNPFRQRRLSDPALIRHLLLDPNLTVIRLADEGEDWYSQFACAIAQHGIVQLAASRDADQRLRSAIVRIVSSAVDVGFLQFFPCIERIEKDENEIRVVVTIREQA